MKNMLLAFIVFSLVGCATTDYVGETYAPTSHVDVYFATTDIGRPYKVIGQSKTEGSEYMSFELMQEQLVKDAMAKGADAVLIGGMETVVTGSYTSTDGTAKENPRYVITKDGKVKNKGGSGHYNSISTTTDIRDHVLAAKMIKYTE